MPLEPGRNLLHYRIVEKIGEGGMGEVYRAHDSKLDREVAVKVLPDTGTDLESVPAERLVRFQREAQLLASLNHPNIAAIYGLEEVDSVRFLVLELIEGEDLAERLTRGRLPIDEALDVGRQIAEALETAHEQGIIHRDLKPANVKLTPDGKVKVLDFGLAKALETTSNDKADPSQSPTITAASTQAGVIMGTAAYMSPEQARGSEVDRRADIWSFGCLLLELLTNRNPFVEDTISDTLASVLRSDPDLERLPPEAPTALRRLIRRCLHKDPLQRLRDIGEARIAIEGILSGEVEAEIQTEAPQRRQSMFWVTTGAILLTAVIMIAIVNSQLRSQTPPEPRDFEILHEGFDHDRTVSPVLSPDGRKLIFSRDGELWLRRIDQLDPQRLEGTKGAEQPAWSPDSTSIVFSAGGDLRTLQVPGGSPTTLVVGMGSPSQSGGIDWGHDGRIVYTTTSGTAIVEVSSRGGNPREILVPDGEKSADFHTPSLLPDGSILFVTHRIPEGPDTIELIQGKERTVLIQFDGESLGSPVYSPTGHIVFRRSPRNTGIWALPFTLATHEVAGDPFLVHQDGSQPSIADDGTMAYVRGVGTAQQHLVWVSREGVVGEAVGQPMTSITKPALSPDETRVAVMGLKNEYRNIWVLDLVRGTPTRLTFNSVNDWDPAWSADSHSIIYWDGATRVISRIDADGGGKAEPLDETIYLDSGVPSLTPDGKHMAFWVKNREGEDIWIMPLDGEKKARPFLESRFLESDVELSPDGKFAAYISNESGREEVYLTRFPGGEGKWQVSANGGVDPIWSPAGGDLFYLEGTLMKVVSVTLDDSVNLGPPQTLFDVTGKRLAVSSNTGFAVSADGQQLLMVQNVVNEGKQPSLIISYDWIARFEN